MNYVFGPVPSRRLGQSLGIDPIPLKTCNWNCVYCQLGRTVPLTNQRCEYVPTQDVLADAERALESRWEAEIDWVTFVGSGEPTLHSGLGEMIRGVKCLTKLPVAVITNGSLLYRSQVRAALAAADAVLPTLDAGNPALYRRINRPHPAVTFERLVDGLCEFRRQFSGKLWIEVMLLQGLNDGEQELSEIADTMQRIRPDEVHINLPTRPPCETWVRPASAEALSRATSILGAVSRVVRPAAGKFDKGRHEDIIEAVVDIITRHPVSQQELEAVLTGWAPGDLKRALAALQESGKAQTVERYGQIFWAARDSRFPSRARSEATRPKLPRLATPPRKDGRSGHADRRRPDPSRSGPNEA
jgi:wyosine [tRNA(Phe)-imidazoG37] synthetase (radical SAM superfamily)